MMLLALSSLILVAEGPRQSRTRSVEPPSVQITIDPDGSCRVLQSSGDPEQDAKTCAVVKACAAKSPNLKEAMAKCDTTSLARKREE